jgi:hypothetical protein
MYISRNGLTPAENREIGSLARTFFLLAILLFGLKIWGANVFEDPWFYLMELIAYFFAGWFLRKIKVWLY